VQRLFFWVVLPSVIGLTWIVRMSAGSWTNTLLPMYAVLAVALGLGWHRAQTKLMERPKRSGRAVMLVTYLIVIVQFGILIYDPVPYIPVLEDLEAGEAIVDKVRAIEGEVFIPYHSYIAGLAGKKVYGHEMAIDDILKRAPKEWADRLADSIRATISSGKFEAIIIDRRFFQSEIESNYYNAGPVFHEPHIFLTRSGWSIRPETIYLRK
jgi:hypothetical protein